MSDPSSSVLAQMEDVLARPLPGKRQRKKEDHVDRDKMMDVTLQQIDYRLSSMNADRLFQFAEKIVNAGSVFIGNFSCESAGDYASGTNHTLPTGGAARVYSGVSVASFTKTITFQRLTADGIRTLGPTIEIMAAAEGLDAHKNAVAIRREWVGGQDGI